MPLLPTDHCPLTTAFSPCNAKETVYTPNGTQLRKRRSGAHLQTLGLVPGGYVLYLGRFSPEKNCDLLIDAFEKTQTPFKLVLAGGSSHTDKYVARLRQHESDQIKFLDWLSGDALEEVLTKRCVVCVAVRSRRIVTRPSRRHGRGCLCARK